MATSGIILLALNKPAHVNISRQFEKRLTQKNYIARVFGKVEKSQGSVDQPLICDWPNRPKQKVDHEQGKAALTHYQVLSYDKNNDNQITTLLALTPVTGRSHQLRVHMLCLGHPIIGDRLYAHPLALSASNRLQLHAQMLQIAHPVSEQTLTFTKDCPFN
jgi:tRNA pseudouridine32 synthase/23S rRNA pseudouridine746 synthase